MRRSRPAAANRSRDWSTPIITAIRGRHQFFTGAEISSHPYCRNEVLKAVANTPKAWAATPNVRRGRRAARPRPADGHVPGRPDLFSRNVEVQFRFAGPRIPGAT